jgi:hypothetical protein
MFCRKGVTKALIVVYNFFYYSFLYENMTILKKKGWILMICPNCSHQNDGGKFCEKCGTPLIPENTNREEAAASSDARTVLQPESQQVHYQQPVYNQQQSAPVQPQPNRYIESTKKISKMYLGYFFQVLKQPFASTHNVGSEHFINGIITMILYAFLIPFTMYFFIKEAANGINSFGSELFGSSTPSIEIPFTDVVLKPTFAFIIFIFLVALFTFVSVKLGRENATFKETIARFGSLLIPVVAILFVALVMSILNIKLFIVLLVFGILGSLFLVPALVITSFKKQSGGVDAFYGAMITYILTFIAIAIMGDMLLSVFQEAFSNFF